jgi:DNA polymerase elongation subunit (family B)
MQFRELLEKSYNDCGKHFLVAHNGIEFDFPYIARRMLIHGIKLPALLNVSGSKSWSNKWLIDTMDLWRFGDYKEKTSLNLLAACFGIESPKDDISGKDVARVYHFEHDLERISTYCKKDVATLTRIFLKFAGLSEMGEGDVIYL